MDAAIGVATLARPVQSRGRLIGMQSLHGYLILPVLLLAVRAVQVSSSLR